MNISLESYSHKALVIEKQLPPNYTGPRLPGGEILFATGEFGELCLQEFNGRNFLIRYSVLHTKQHFVLGAQSHLSGMHVLMMLKNEIELVFKNAASCKVHEGQFTIIQADQPAATVSFQPAHEFICFEAVLSPLFSSLVQKDFPELSFNDPPPEIPDILVDPALEIDGEVREHIRYIFTYSHPEKWRKTYFQNRVRSIAWKLLALYLSQEPGKEELNERDKNTAYAVQRLIVDHLNKHELIKDLAGKVGVSSSRLKEIFRKVFRMGIHEYRIYERLKKAIALMHEGMSVKEAAGHTGWRAAELIRAYYKVYGTTPGTITKKKR